MGILDTIVAHKKKEASEQKELVPVKLLEKSPFFSAPTVSLRHYLAREGASGIVAEIKRKSPSRGTINEHISVEDLSIGYMRAGASALSVLTDSRFFGGTLEDLRIARKFNFCPILRKDFMIDEYQILEARSAGADVILLIAAILTPAEVKSLSSLARSLDLEVLLEVHSLQELESHLTPAVSLVGINNRNLDTLEVSLKTSEELFPHVPKEFSCVSESGIREAGDLMRLKQQGFRGFLIGEQFMRHSRPDLECARFIEEVSACALR